jgi:hypothetical protein
VPRSTRRTLFRTQTGNPESELLKLTALASIAFLLLGGHFACAQTNAPIPWQKLGAMASTESVGDGLAISATTFSDANWISMYPSIPGANGLVRAAVVDGSGNLYIGG